MISLESSSLLDSEIDVVGLDDDEDEGMDDELEISTMGGVEDGSHPITTTVN